MNLPHFAAGKHPVMFLHVAPGGTDAAGCGTEEAPCSTLAAAVGTATPGTAVRIHAGTYEPEQISDVAGTAEAPIWIGGAPGEDRPVFVGGSPILHFSRLRHVVMHDLEIAHTLPSQDTPALIVDDGEAYADPTVTQFVAVERVSVRDVDTYAASAVRLAGVNDFWLLDSELVDMDAYNGLEIIGSHRGVVARNAVNGARVAGVVIGGGSSDVEIRNNRIFDVIGGYGVWLGTIVSPEAFRPPVAPGADIIEVQDVRVLGNLIVAPGAAVSFNGCVGCLVANNTIVFPNYSLLSFFPGSGGVGENPRVRATADNRFVNNITYYRRSDVGAKEYYPPSFPTLATNSLHTNLWYAADDPEASSPVGLPLTDYGSMAGIDPGFVDVAGGDYHLKPDSPAVSSGTPLAALSTDLDGACFDDPPSRGALQ
ncbi:right-handed parallel beta-helix repeat-containing protein [Sorangium sp. So ce327]|uniref:hypothetical protein n=1 Tax=Sorangium sp. So ce327 TaxID=3133301 RepID=UPI003F613F2B